MRAQEVYVTVHCTCRCYWCSGSSWFDRR